MREDADLANLEQQGSGVADVPNSATVIRWLLVFALNADDSTYLEEGTRELHSYNHDTKVTISAKQGRTNKREFYLH